MATISRLVATCLIVCIPLVVTTERPKVCLKHTPYDNSGQLSTDLWNYYASCGNGVCSAQKDNSIRYRVREYTAEEWNQYGMTNYHRERMVEAMCGFTAAISCEPHSKEVRIKV